MSDKRFKKMDTIIDPFPILDTVEELGYNCTDTLDLLVDLLNELSEENGQLKKVNNLLYNENIQLRRILVNYKDLIYDVKYLEEKRVFDGEKDKKNIWDVEPVVEKHS